MTRKNTEPGPLELLFMLFDSCMHLLSPNAWKVVCYVAGNHLRAQNEWLDRHQDPAKAAFERDLEKKGIINPPDESGERRYRSVPDGPGVPGERGPARFAVISLDQMCQGVRTNKRRYQDYGTGLAKSSVAEAIKEAVQLGVLVHERNKSTTGRDLPSLYGIDWEKVQFLDWQRRKGLQRR